MVDHVWHVHKVKQILRQAVGNVMTVLLEDMPVRLEQAYVQHVLLENMNHKQGVIVAAIVL